jgi:hypothetical protein
VAILIRDGLRTRKTTIPFGPFMSLGDAIVLFGPHWVCPELSQWPLRSRAPCLPRFRMAARDARPAV